MINVFDASSGTLTFERPAVAIAPSLTRDEFLASALALGATTHVENEPHHSWRLEGTYASAGVAMTVVLWFDGGRLAMISLNDSDPRFGTSWDDASPAKERARLASHDAWLTRSLDEQREFSWGSVWSGFDSKAGFSDLRVYYARARG